LLILKLKNKTGIKERKRHKTAGSRIFQDIIISMS
jgi:hypothetical protein